MSSIDILIPPQFWNLGDMEKRHSSPSDMAASPRPKTHRKRSNSFPIVEALGCSTPEAELILAEGRAAVRSRQAPLRRRRHRMKDGIGTFRPRDHIKYLCGGSAVSDKVDEESISPVAYRASGHSRIPSNGTTRSSSTIIAPIQPPVDEAPATTGSLASPLGDYSANLSKFIQSQLNSIPTYKPAHSSISPSSCPDLTFQARSPPQSPAKSTKRPVGGPHTIEIPPVRPPLKSAFSEWSSTDDETDDEVPPLPDADADAPRKDPNTSNSTPSVLGYYEHSHNSSFLLSSTPLEEEDQPDTAKAFSFPNQSEVPESSAEPQAPAQDDDDYPSSALSTRPQLTSSSAPSSASTGPYFDYKRPISLAPQIKDRIIAAVTPPHSRGKVLTAISPFEGATLANVHDVLVESQQRVHVDGMTFDMLRDITIPDESMRRVPTPC